MSVLTYIENWDGKFKKLSFELLSYSAKLAEMAGTKSIALTIGTIADDELAQLAKYGPDKILNVQNPGVASEDNKAYAAIIADVAKKNGATVVVLSNNNNGKALAPRVSVRLGAGIGSGVSKLPVSVSPFVVYKKVYSGNAYANLEIKSEVKVLTLAQNSFEIIENPKSAAVEKTSVDGISASGIQVLDTQKQSGKILLTDAEIVVSGGRGMKSPDNWAPLVELADVLGAATACSRPVSDEGWRSHEEHTGQTGKIIAPNLYFAIGISGATQHLAGISGSKYIVAINSDKDAPIFEAAQYGIIGDAAKVLPALVAAVKTAKAK